MLLLTCSLLSRSDPIDMQVAPNACSEVGRSARLSVFTEKMKIYIYDYVSTLDSGTRRFETEHNNAYR